MSSECRVTGLSLVFTYRRFTVHRTPYAVLSTLLSTPSHCLDLYCFGVIETSLPLMITRAFSMTTGRFAVLFCGC